jgi:hypothetical protein
VEQRYKLSLRERERGEIYNRIFMDFPAPKLSINYSINHTEQNEAHRKAPQERANCFAPERVFFLCLSAIDFNGK